MNANLIVISIVLAALFMQPLKAAKQEKPSDEFKQKLALAIANAGDSFEDKFDAKVWLLEQSNRLQYVASHISEDERLLFPHTSRC